MSNNLIELSKSFVNAAIDADNFTSTYIVMWKAERDSGLLTVDGKMTDEASSTIFSLADCYNPAKDREEYELNEIQLREKIQAVLIEFGFE